MIYIYRIPGHFRKWFEGRFPHFRCTITIGGKHHIRTNVLLDTGSPFTPITPKDYLKIRLHVKPTTKEKICYLAAAKFYRLPIVKSVEYKFRTEDNKLQKIPYDNSIFLVPTSNVNIKRVQAIPSILGLDFLTKNNMRFIIDPKKEIAYIEGDLEE